MMDYDEIRDVMEVAEKAEKKGCDVVAVFREFRRLSDEGIELAPDEAFRHFQRIGWGEDPQPGCLYDTAAFFEQDFICQECGREISGEDFVYFPADGKDRTLCGSCIDAEVTT